MRQRVWLYQRLAVGVMVSFLMTACGERPGETGAEISGEESVGVEPTVTGAEGQEVEPGEEAQIPADFPSDVPLYKNLTLQAVVRDPAKQTLSIRGTSEDSVEELSRFFVEQAQAEGWAKVETVKQGGDEIEQLSCEYAKGDRTLGILLAKKVDGTSVELTTTIP